MRPFDPSTRYIVRRFAPVWHSRLRKLKNTDKIGSLHQNTVPPQHDLARTTSYLKAQSAFKWRSAIRKACNHLINETSVTILACEQSLLRDLRKWFSTEPSTCSQYSMSYSIVNFCSVRRIRSYRLRVDSFGPAANAGRRM